MKTSIRQFGALVRVTMLEGARQPICILLTAAACLAGGLLPLIIAHQFGEPGRLARDGTQSLHYVLGMFLSALLACTVFRNEAHRGTAGAILCKPVKRSIYFLARFTGVALVVLAYSWCMVCSALLVDAAASRMFEVQWFPQLALMVSVGGAFLGGGLLNYSRRTCFSSSALGLLVLFLFVAVGLTGFRGSSTGVLLRWELVASGGLLGAATLLFVGVAFCVAPACKAAVTVVVCAAVFFLGLFTDYLVGRAAEDAGVLLRGALRMIPNWQLFWMVDLLADGGAVPPGYLAGALLYTGFYLAGLLCLGLFLFESREV